MRSRTRTVGCSSHQFPIECVTPSGSGVPDGFAGEILYFDSSDTLVTLAPGATNTILRIGPTGEPEWIDASTVFEATVSVGDLSDVDLDVLSDGDVFVYNSATSQWENVDVADLLAFGNLGDLGDVVLTSPVSGDVIRLNASNQWVNVPGSSLGGGGGGAVVLNDLTDVNTAGVINGDFLRFDGVNFVRYPLSTLVTDLGAVFGLGDLSDVSTAGANGTVLTKTGASTFEFTSIATGSTTLDGLTDTTLSAPANGDLLFHNGIAWVDLDIDTVAGLIELQDLNDVLFTGLSTGQGLVYDGANFTNQNVVVGGGASERFLFGYISSGGAILAGSGFTVLNTSAGRYTITFSSSFTGSCAAVATISNALGAGNDRVIRTISPTASNFDVEIRTTAGTLINESFSFMCGGNI